MRPVLTGFLSYPSFTRASAWLKLDDDNGQILRVWWSPLRKPNIFEARNICKYCFVGFVCYSADLHFNLCMDDLGVCDID